MLALANVLLWGLVLLAATVYVVFEWVKRTRRVSHAGVSGWMPMTNAQWQKIMHTRRRGAVWISSLVNNVTTGLLQNIRRDGGNLFNNVIPRLGSGNELQWTSGLSRGTIRRRGRHAFSLGPFDGAGAHHAHGHTSAPTDTNPKAREALSPPGRPTVVQSRQNRHHGVGNRLV